MTLNLNGKEILKLIKVLEYYHYEEIGLGDEAINRKLLKKLEKVLKPIKVSSRKGKGRGLQQFVCSKIAELFNIKYNQQDDDCPIHSREMGQAGTDIVLRGAVRQLLKFDIECKNTESVSLYKFIEQSKLNTQPGREWLVVHKKNQSKPVAILDFDIFINLLKTSFKNLGKEV